MADYVIHGTAADNQVRCFAASTRDLVEQARRYHNTSPVATAALGRLLTAGAMMGTMMKDPRDLLSLKIQCDGPIGGLFVTAAQNGNVRGYVNNPAVILPGNSQGKLDVAGALGEGMLYVTRDLGLREPYVGYTRLQTGEIGEDLTYYFASSEQTPSSVGLGVLMGRDNQVRQAGGFILQLMPGAGEEVASALERNLAKVHSVTGLLEEGLTPQDILEKLTSPLGFKFMGQIPVAYHCGCCREKVEKILLSLGRAELQDMADKGEPVQVECHFCDKKYQFGPEEIKGLMG